MSNHSNTASGLATEPSRILRRPEVQQLTGLTNSVMDRAIRSGHFPRPVRLLTDPRSRAVGWRLRDVRAWLESRSEAAA